MAEHVSGSAERPSDGQGDGSRGPVSAPAQDAASPPNVLQRVTRFFDSTTKVLVAIGGLIAAVTALVTFVVHLVHAGQVPQPPHPVVQGTGQSVAQGTGQSSVPLPLTAPSGLAVKIDAVSLVRDSNQAGTYVFPQKQVFSAAELRTLNQFGPSQPQYDVWFRSRGAVDPDSSNLKLVVEGNRIHPVEITGLRLIKQCQQPLNGTLFLSPPAGADNNLKIGFNLDSPASIAQDYSGPSYGYTLSGDYFAEHTISLRYGDVQTLQVVAVTVRQYCAYTLELTAVDGSTSVTEPITDHGRPFRVTAVKWIFPHQAFSYFKALYVGGVEPAAAARHGDFAAENPKTYPHH